jgi:predicted nuclease with TOPRIM domain
MSSERQQRYLERLQQNGVQIVRFPLETVHIEQALKLFPSDKKQTSLHSAFVHGITSKLATTAEYQEQQVDMLDRERIEAMAERDQLREKNKAFKTVLDDLQQDKAKLQQQVAALTEKLQQVEGKLKDAQATAAHSAGNEALARVITITREGRAEVNAAANNPKTKQPDPSKIPTWKNLHRFLLRLEEVLNE